MEQESVQLQSRTALKVTVIGYSNCSLVISALLLFRPARILQTHFEFRPFVPSYSFTSLHLCRAAPTPSPPLAVSCCRHNDLYPVPSSLRLALGARVGGRWYGAPGAAPAPTPYPIPLTPYPFPPYHPSVPDVRSSESVLGRSRDVELFFYPLHSN